MKKIPHGTLYEIPLDNNITEGYGYIRFLRNDTLYNKPDGYFKTSVDLIQLIKVNRSSALKSLNKIDWSTAELFCHPHSFFGTVPTRGREKWKKLGVVEEMPHLDYSPAYNQDMRLWALEDSLKDETHRVVLDALNTEQSFAYLPPERVMHLPTSMRMNYETAVETLNYFWAMENNFSPEEVCKRIGYSPEGIDPEKMLGSSWQYAKYYYALFSSIPSELRGVPLPEGDSILNYTTI